MFQDKSEKLGGKKKLCLLFFFLSNFSDLAFSTDLAFRRTMIVPLYMIYIYSDSFYT